MGWLGMETSENNVPEAVKSEEKKRSQADKIGKHKYEIQRMNRIDAKLERIEQMQRIIFQGLSGYFRFDRPLVEKVCCESEMDFAVVSVVYEAGSNGLLAKEISPRFPQYKLEKHKILRIVNRVNRNCVDAFGRPLIEKRGKKWSFTDFGVEIWGKTKKDLETEVEVARSNVSEEEIDVDA
jgi:hypothetical protein